MAHQDGLEKLARHEARLERQLVLAYHQLERSQARRQGAQVTPPAVIDVVVSGPAPAQSDVPDASSTERQTIDPPAPTGDEAFDSPPVQTAPEAPSPETEED
jgi:hypothetical protein